MSKCIAVQAITTGHGYCITTTNIKVAFTGKAQMYFTV